jgi:formate dehydrogenase subunit gamma
LEKAALTEKKTSSLFTRRVVGSVLAYSIICGLGLAWLFFYVVNPMLAPFQFTIQYELSIFFDLLTAFLILFAVIFNSLDLTKKIRSGSHSSSESPEETRYVQRFSLNQRIQHIWLIATVGICALTGFDQFYLDSWGRPVVLFLGGYQNNINLHLLSAFLLGVLVVYHFTYYAVGYVAGRLTGKPISLKILPTKKELSDFFASMKYLFGPQPYPKFDKYSFVQKFDYWGIYWGIAILGLPGILLWVYGYSAFAGLPYIFHTKEAILAVFWIWMFHFYHTHLYPDKFPVNWLFLTGRMSEKELSEEHPLELERIKAEDPVSKEIGVSKEK